MTIFLLILFTGGGHTYQVPYPYPTEAACVSAARKAPWATSKWTDGNEITQPLPAVVPFTCIGATR